MQTSRSRTLTTPSPATHEAVSLSGRASHCCSFSTPAGTLDRCSRPHSSTIAAPPGLVVTAHSRSSPAAADLNARTPGRWLLGYQLHVRGPSAALLGLFQPCPPTAHCVRPSFTPGPWTPAKFAPPLASLYWRLQFHSWGPSPTLSSHRPPLAALVCPVLSALHTTNAGRLDPSPGSPLLDLLTFFQPTAYTHFCSFGRRAAESVPSSIHPHSCQRPRI